MPSKLQTIEIPDRGGSDKPLKFKVRPNTSDKKAIMEVVGKRAYARHGFEPMAEEHWLDLGANIGAFTVWAARRGATVDAYEPDPDMCDLIVANAKLNRVSSRVSVHQVAVLADEPNEGHITLHRNTARGNVWRSSVERSWQGGEDIEVPTIEMADVCEEGTERDWRKALLKMDIEGSEMAILEEFISHEVSFAAMVFEWTFDVDRSIPRFLRVIEGLRELYGDVRYGGFDETEPEWKPSWFPPCRLVYCS